MTPSKNTLAERMRQNAEAVSAVVASVPSMEAAMDYAVDLCTGKEACEPLLSGCAEPLSSEAGEYCPDGAKTLAAPNLTKAQFAALSRRAKAGDILPLQTGLRSRLGGVDLALTRTDYGVADTGSLVLCSDSEETRLATMISEIHVAVLPVSRIVADLDALSPKLGRLIAPGKSAPATYTAFITGASRTSDIERVLTLGVHGPLELHILLLEDD